jgi:hypothetical protein
MKGDYEATITRHGFVAREDLQSSDQRPVRSGPCLGTPMQGPERAAQNPAAPLQSRFDRSGAKVSLDSLRAPCAPIGMSSSARPEMVGFRWATGGSSAIPRTASPADAL